MSSLLCGTCVRQQEEMECGIVTNQRPRKMGEKEEKRFDNVMVDLRSKSDVYYSLVITTVSSGLCKRVDGS